MSIEPLELMSNLFILQNSFTLTQLWTVPGTDKVPAKKLKMPVKDVQVHEHIHETGF